MSTAKVTSKGQITIPADVRTTLGIETGDRVTFVHMGGQRFEIVAATGSVKALKGLIQRPTRPVSIEDMNKAIRRRAARS